VAKARLSPRGNDRSCCNIWLEKTGLCDNSNPVTWDWERLTFVKTQGGSLFLIDIKSAFNMSFFSVYVQFLTVYFSLQVKNKPHDGIANYAFILELYEVTNRRERFNYCDVKKELLNSCNA
jgi:hypothetical protein